MKHRKQRTVSTFSAGLANHYLCIGRYDAAPDAGSAPLYHSWFSFIFRPRLDKGTAPGYSGDALYVRDGVKQIITAAQPALAFTGHVIKQKASRPISSL